MTVNESELNLFKYQKFERTGRFLEAALKDQAHLKIPVLRNGRLLNVNSWTTEKNAIGVYFGSPATKEDVAKFVLQSGNTREAGRQALERGMWHLWINCSPSIQSEFPWDSFSLDKPRSVKSRIQESLSKGGTSAQIAKLIDTGAGYEEIRQAGFSVPQIANARIVLSNWGVNVPLAPNKGVEFLNSLLEEEDMGTLQSKMGQISLSFYHMYRENFTGVRTLVIQAGFHVRPGNTTMFIDSLNRAGVPMAIVSQEIKSGKHKRIDAHIILAKHCKLGKEIFQSDDILKAQLKTSA